MHINLVAAQCTRAHLNKASVRGKNHKIKLNLRHHRLATLLHTTYVRKEIFYTLCIRFARKSKKKKY